MSQNNEPTGVKVEGFVRKVIPQAQSNGYAYARTLANATFYNDDTRVLSLDDYSLIDTVTKLHLLQAHMDIDHNLVKQLHSLKTVGELKIFIDDVYKATGHS